MGPYWQRLSFTGRCAGTINAWFQEMGSQCGVQFNMVVELPVSFEVNYHQITSKNTMGEAMDTCYLLIRLEAAKFKLSHKKASHWDTSFCQDHHLLGDSNLDVKGFRLF